MSNNNAPAAEPAIAPTPSGTAAPIRTTPAATTATATAPAVAEPDDAIPAPRTTDMPTAAAAAVEQDAATWITKEAGNRRIPYDRARLERAIDRVHAEFPQLDIVDYKRNPASPAF